MGGKKIKIEIKEIERKVAKTVAFTKRRDGLFRKASKLCLLSPATQIAILATPMSSNSHASFYSFGHSSVDRVVSSLLYDQPLPANQDNSSELGFWWEDKSFDVSENVEELKEAVDAVSRMLNNVRLRLNDAVESTQRDGGLEILHQEEEVLQIRNEETKTNQIPNFEGETSASLLANEEDILHFDDFFTDIDSLF